MQGAGEPLGPSALRWHGGPLVRWGRVVAQAALVAGVVALHQCVIEEVADHLVSHQESLEATPIRRMDVAFITPLAPAPPPEARSTSPKATGTSPSDTRRITRPMKTSGPTQGPAPAPEAEVLVQAPDVPASGVAEGSGETLVEAPMAEPALTVTEAASATDAQAQAVAVAEEARLARPSGSQAGPETGGFAWPPSTRLDFSLTGHYRGPIEGSARVQWIRRADQYQVQMDVFVGPEFAALMTRRMTSEGVLNAQGLAPRRYDEETRVAFSTRRAAITLDVDHITLTQGLVRSRPQGAQDSASQFVQMSFLFTSNPSLLKAGNTITVPVALPRRLDQWIYDVVGEATVDTPMGPIQTFHVKPRRESPRPGELVAQAWYAPTLQYLPVRILIHQDGETFVDMVLKAPPTQAEPSR